jgi:hypothetical protein
MAFAFFQFIDFAVESTASVDSGAVSLEFRTASNLIISQTEAKKTRAVVLLWRSPLL